MMVNILSKKATIGFALTALMLLAVTGSYGQTYNYSQGNLDVDVFISNPCDGLDNGFITFTVNSANGGSANLLIIQGPKSFFTVTNIPVGSTFVFNDAPLSGTPSLPSGDYDFIIVDINSIDVINTFPNAPPRPATLTALPAIGINILNQDNNTSCITPDGRIRFQINGGSKTPNLPMGEQGSFTYTWTSDNGAILPPPTTVNGIQPILLDDIRGGTYTVLIEDNYSICSASFDFIITEPTPTIALVNSDVEVCSGETSVNLAYSATTNTPNQYSITFDGASIGQGFANVVNAALPASPIILTVPASALPDTYNATLRVTNTTTGCFNETPITITVKPNPDATITPAGPFCETDTPVLLVAATAGGTWSGVGITNALTGEFSPSIAGVGIHTITYSVTVDGCTSIDTEDIEVQAAPDATITPAGPFCETDAAINLVAASPNGVWSGVGITDAINGTFDPSVAGPGSHIITYTVSVGVCTSVYTETIIVELAATVDAGPAQEVCSDQTVTLAGTFGGSATSVTWTTSGDGTFSDATSTTAIYTPGTTDIANGTVTLTLTTNDPAGNCPSVNDTVIITITPAATVDAGPAQEVCSDQTVTLAGTFGGSATSVTWTTSGDGTFSDATSTTAIYTPGTTDIANGTVTLTLTTNDPAGNCPSVNDTVIITITPAATVDAGPAQEVCSDQTVTLAGTFGGSATSVTWTTSGDGTFSDATSTTAIYTPGTTDIANGTVTLTLTTNDPAGNCPSVNDTVIITITPAATVDAGPAQEVCSDQTVTLAGTFGGSATSVTWTTSGDGTFDDATSTTAIYTPGTTDISNGTVTLTLTTNDPAGNCPSVNDTVIITITPAATVDAGPAQEVCSDQTVTLAGTFGGSATSVTWTTSGDGTFNNAASPTAIYTPGTNDIANGTVTLTLTTNDPAGNCPSVNDTVIITITPAATVDAGPAQEVCSDQTVTLAGTFGGSATTVTWTTSGDGTFSDATSPTAIYTPGTNDIANGTVTLTLTTNDPAGNCPSVNDTVIITITPAATVDAGPAQEVCSDQTVTLAGTFGGSATSVTWTTSGDGTFNNAASPTAIYTPGTNDIANGTVTLTLTTNDPAGNCPSVNDTVIITITPAATVDAGPAQEVCSDQTVTLAGTFGGSATSVTWTTSGDGTFSDATSPTAIYTPGTNDIANGTVTLTLTTDDPAGNCPSVNDTVIITITPAATVDAGPAQEVCSDQTVTLAGTFGGSATTVTWTTSGDGTFSDATSPTAIYTPGTNDISNGTVTLTLTTNDPAGNCPSVNDTVIITITPAATVDAGPAQEVCSDQTVTLAGTFGGSATTVTLTTSGDGTFSDATSPTAIYTPGTNDISNGTVTLTLTTNDPAGNCPSVNDTVIITIDPAATVDAGLDQSICTGNTVTLSGLIGGSATSSTWSTSGDGTFNDASLLSAVYTPGTNDIATGSVTLTLTTNDPAGICPAASDAIVITISTSSTAILSGDNTICQGESTDLVITLTGVAPWEIVYTDGTTNFTINNILTSPLSVSVTPASTVTYTLVSVMDQCVVPGTVSGSAAITVQPDAPPTEAGLSGDNTICSGESTDLVVTITGGLAPYEVTINDGSANTIVSGYLSGDAITVNPAATTSYTIASVIDANGCNALSLVGSAAITVSPSPTNAVLSGSVTICPGDDATLSVTITDGTGPFTFTLDNGVGVVTNYDSGDPIIVSPALTTTYSIVGDVEDDNGCSVSATGSAIVTVSDAPTAALTGTTSICDGQSTDLVVTLTGVGPWNIVYTDGTSNFPINNIATSPLNIPVSPVSTTVYDLVSVEDGCSTGTVSGTATVTLRSTTDPICAGTGIGCFAYSIIVVDSQTKRPSCSNQNDGVVTLNVTGVTPGNYIIRLQSPTVTLTQTGPSGIYVFSGLSPDTYEYYIEDAAGNICQQPYDLPLETSVIASAADFVDVECFGSPTGLATFTIISGGNSPFEYSVDGTTWKSFFPGVPVTDLPPNGTYPVLIRDGATDLCPFTVSVTINNNNPAISIAFDTQDATCGNNDGSISIVTPPAGGTGGPYTYLLDGNPATPVNETFSSLFGGNHVITVIDNSGCEREFTVVVPYPDLIAIAGLNSTDASCNELGNISILIDNFIPAAQYEVAITNSISTVPTEYFTQYYLGNGLVSITELSRGNYFVWLKTTGAQCPTLVNNLINNEPIVLAGPIPLSFDVSCRYSNGDLQLIDVSGAPGLPYQYEVFGNGFLAQGSFTPDPLGNAIISGFITGPYSVNLIQNQASIGGCVTAQTGFSNAPLASLDTVSVTVPAPANKLELSFPEKGTASRLIKIQESGIGDYEIRLELVDPFGADDPSPVSDWQIVSNQEIRYDNLYAGNYILSLRDGYGCQKNYDLTIEMFTGIWIPNIFTPNNDGSNDSFYIRNLPASGSKLIVTNRWGTQVYSSSNYKSEIIDGVPVGDWSGNDVPDGVYYYRLEANGESFTGWVEVLRGQKP